MATALKTRRRDSKKRPVARPGTDIRALRKTYALPQLLTERLLDALRRTATGESNGSTASPVRQLDKLCQALADVMVPSYIAQWLDQPNEMFMGLKPVEKIERGRIDHVWQVVEGLRSGSYL